MTPPTGQLRDGTLLEAARRGDVAATRALIDRHLPRITAVCRKRLGSQHDVDDAVMETVERALRHLDQLEDPDRLGAWLRAIAARVCLDLHRSTARGPLSMPASDLPHEVHRPSEGLDSHVLSAEEAENVHARLGTLPERDRVALWWRDALGVPVDEIAANLGVTRGAARTLLSRARARFRDGYVGLVAFLFALRGGRRNTDRPIEAASVSWGAITHAVVAVVAVTTTAGLGPQAMPAPAAAGASIGHPVEAVTSTTPGALTATPARDTADVEPVRPAVPGPAAAAPPRTSGRHAADVGPVVISRDEPDDEPIASTSVPAVDEGIEVDVYSGQVSDFVEATAEEVVDELPVGTP